MIDPKIVEEIVKEGIQETDLFVVDITVTPRQPYRSGNRQR